MHRSFAVLVGALGVSVLGAAACSSSECAGEACAGPIDAGSDVVDSGPSCADGADPKDEPGCVDETFGVFVDKEGGSDANAGTRASPLQSMRAALEKLGDKKRVFLCEGNYFEHVTLTRGISVHGGFACGDWSYTGAKARFAPNDTGYILQVALASEPLMVSDLVLEAVGADAAGASSVAAFITRSAKVTLRRMTISAGAGAAGVDGTDGLDYEPEHGPDGYAGDAELEAGKARQNPGCGTSIGGAGGRDGAPSGRAGQASRSPAFPEAHTGAGGAAATPCDEGGAGVDGAFGLGGASGRGASRAGALDTTGWK
ncbi:MAG: hypothetical protein KF795_27915, partial [Labilithrix sp.]|nr:hypothetical protein [Labilithrix sp.]